MTESELMEYEELCDQILARYRDSHGMVDTAIRELVRKSMLLSIENERLRTTRPEPSRLEIAAILLAGMLSNVEAIQRAETEYWTQDMFNQECTRQALAQADALIAAAKGGE